MASFTSNSSSPMLCSSPVPPPFSTSMEKLHNTNVYHHHHHRHHSNSTSFTYADTEEYQHLANTSATANNINNNNISGLHYEELWRACAGPLVSLPKLKQLVMYLPQGHIEQIAASTNQVRADSNLIPKHDLRPHILCRVMDVQLSAEPDTDEVKAQISLLPEPDMDHIMNSNHDDDVLCKSVSHEEGEIGGKLQASSSSSSSSISSSSPSSSSSSSSCIHIFCKTLTASDTSTHGGFSVPRRHATCLPPLDMAQNPPTQDLVAMDLHGLKWHFRHIYRGQPKRHLLTTGWSVFVSQKRLVAGDSVIFLRGEGGELRVGIRRAMRLSGTSPSSVLPSESMHMGVIATATHAMLTRTMFSVYFKPRVSPGEFIVALDRFKNSLNLNLAVGMRFKMKFEAEDSTERRYVGTITGIEDLDPARWPSSKWKSLKVGWDEPSLNNMKDRVSPWEIDQLCSLQIPSPGPAVTLPRCKRLRPSTIPSTTEHSPLTGESVMSGKCGLVLQGQESRANVFPSEDGMYPLPHHLHMHRFGKLADKLWGGFPPYFDATSNFNFQVPRVNDLPANNWFLSPTMVAQRSPTPHCNNRSLPSPSANGGLLLLDQEINKIISQSIMKHQSQLAYNGSTCSSPWKPNVVQPMETQSTPQGSAEATRPSECKLFGFSLTDPPPVRKILAKTHVEGNVVGAVNHLCMSNNYSIENEVDQQTPASIKPAMAMQDIISTTTSGSEADKPARPHIGGRSCTKVVKKGSIVGRGVDLSKLENYEQLFEELERMFHLEGQLRDKEKGWQVAYSDNEDDMLEVGDDPWMEFCNMVKKIHILSREEVAQGSKLSRIVPS